MRYMPASCLALSFGCFGVDLRYFMAFSVRRDSIVQKIYAQLRFLAQASRIPSPQRFCTRKKTTAYPLTIARGGNEVLPYSANRYSFDLGAFRMNRIDLLVCWRNKCACRRSYLEISPPAWTGRELFINLLYYASVSVKGIWERCEMVRPSHLPDAPPTLLDHQRCVIK